MEIKLYNVEDIINPMTDELYNKVLLNKIKENPNFVWQLALDLGHTPESNIVYQQLLSLIKHIFEFSKLDRLLLILSKPTMLSDNNGQLSDAYKIFLQETDSLITKGFFPYASESTIKIQQIIDSVMTENIDIQVFNNTKPLPPILFVVLIKGKAQMYQVVFSNRHNTLPPFPLADIANIKKFLYEYIEYHFMPAYGDIPYRIDFVVKEEEDIFELEVDQWKYSDTELLVLGEMTNIVMKSLDKIRLRHPDGHNRMKGLLDSFKLMEKESLLLVEKDEDLLSINIENKNKYIDKKALFICLEQTEKNKNQFRDAIKSAIEEFYIPIIVFFRKCSTGLKLSEFVDSIKFHSQEEDILQFVRSQRQYKNHNVNPIGKNIVFIYDDPDDRHQIINAYNSTRPERIKEFRNLINSLNNNDV